MLLRIVEMPLFFFQVLVSRVTVYVGTGTHISGLLVVHSESGLRQHQRSTIDFVPQKSGHQGAVSNAVTIA